VLAGGRDDLAVDVDTAIPMGLIVNELVTNAYKHAFEGRSEGEVKVTFGHNDKHYELTIADNGIGTAGKPMERKGSLGMRLLKDLGKKLKAEIKVLSDNGTQIQLIFPVKAKLK
jgi:two-component sensor histidine kinase